jgi:ribosomal protein S18 acetylase RimI-like enzyme
VTEGDLTAGVHVIVASPDDWARVREIRLAALADAPDAFATTLEEDRARPDSTWRERLERPGVLHLLARAEHPDGEVRDAGLTVVAPASDRPEEAAIYAVWVAPWARGRGVGRALLEAAIRRSTGTYDRLVLDVGDHNEGAIRLYERLGFVPTGRTTTLPPPREHVTEHERARDLEPG